MVSARTNSSHMGQITTTLGGTVINPFACEASRVESGVKTFATRYTKDKHTYTHTLVQIQTHIENTYVHILPSYLPHFESLSRSTRLELMLCKLTLGTAEEAGAELGGHLESITKWWMCNFLWSVRNFFYVRVRKLDCISLFCTCLSKFSHLPVDRQGKKRKEKERIIYAPCQRVSFAKCFWWTFQQVSWDPAILFFCSFNYNWTKSNK